MTTAQLPNKPITVAFIGAGNMARSLIAGLSQGEQPFQLRVADPNEAQLEWIHRNWTGIESSTDNQVVLEGADVVVLAVKPQLMPDVTQAMQAIAQKQRPLFISVAAGVREAALNTHLGGNLPIVRAMPNTPALVQTGATGLYANAEVSSEQRDLAERLLRAVGITLWVSEEAKLDAVTAVSGSGPAYFFLVMEAMEAAAQDLGLAAEDAHLLVMQTALGAARLALESEDSPAELRQRVTSKGGTTEAALQVLQDGGLPELFSKALQAAAQRSDALSRT